ncbi:olfactory receptor 52B6-like [Protopterus annectens]|uniref:olfactory receptor 52B6-like n=1 Tax=Protopterus annectens TaxID=7888 RepID=UPI001CFB2185|nr:olfactory receptor 52B6-like [Protopterus annectens]
MDNSTRITVFLISGLGTKGPIRYTYFVFTVGLYVITISVNFMLFIIIVLRTNLHKPMYIFMCSLAVNSIYGSTAFLPNLSMSILLETNSITVAGCFVQAYCLHTFGSNEIAILTIMSYDRYVAVCNPLHYVSKMTSSRTYKLLMVAIIQSCCGVIILILLTLRLQLCSFTLQKLYCDNMAIAKLSCEDSSVNNYYGIGTMILSMGIPLAIITYCYVQVLRICLKMSVEARAKALQTCSAHLLMLFVFFISTLFTLIQSRLQTQSVPALVHHALSVQFITVPPVVNPIIYGLRTETLKQELLKVFKKCFNTKFIN